MIEAVGPETYTFRGLFSMLGKVTGRRRPVLSVPPWTAYAAAGIMGMFHRDVILTRDEILGLMEDRPILRRLSARAESVPEESGGRKLEKQQTHKDRRRQNPGAPAIPGAFMEVKYITLFPTMRVLPTNRKVIT